MASTNGRNSGTQTAAVLKALLEAVENIDVGTTATAKKDDDTLAAEYGFRPLLRLFEPQQRSDFLRPGLTAKQQQNLILRTLKSNGLAGGSSNSLLKVKRFFEGVREIQERIFEDDAYLPTNPEKENRNEEGDDSSSDNNDQEDENLQSSNSKTAKECQLFLMYAALCAQAVLDGRMEHQSTKNKQKAKELGGESQISIASPTLRLPSQVFEVANYLHAMLFSLHTCGASAESTVSTVLTLCESWWLANAENREHLIVQCLPLLVLSACEEIPDLSNKSHIVRLYKLRDAFAFIDFSSASSDSLRSLLQRVASNPLCLKLPEGRKFLASLLACDALLVRDLHMAFRSQIPNAKNTVLEAYGEIYHRAWKEVAEDDGENDRTRFTGNGDDDDDEKSEDGTDATVREAIEHQVLQDLMHAAIHVASPSTQKSILMVLEPLHADKKNDQVANLLYRLYSPILWRSLTAANASVRRNALTILEKVFPLHNPKRTSFSLGESNDTGSMRGAVLKATAALQIALNDPFPQVRVASSEATAKVCALYWDVLPSQEIHALLNIIVMDHASDSASAAVRAASLEAFIILLGASQTHGVVRNLLPTLGNLIHDKSEKVRLATVKMLLCVKEIRGIRFYHVVPADQLSARFVAEASLHRNPRNLVARELTALMLNSYFPQGPNATTNKQLKRTVTFLATDPAAASVFYANLPDHLEVESVVKFILLLFSCLKSAVEVDQAAQLKEAQIQKKRRHRSSSKEATEDMEKLSASNTALMASLADTIDVIWESITISLDKTVNKSSRDLLEENFFADQVLVDILSHFEQKGLDHASLNDEVQISCRNKSFQTCASLMACAARLGPKSTSEIVSFVSVSMDSLAKDSARTIPLVCSYLAFLCNSEDKTEEVASVLAKSVEHSMGDDVDFLAPSLGSSTDGRRRSSLRKAGTNASCAIPILLGPQLVWNVLECVLQGSSSACRTIRDALLASDAGTSCLQKAFQKGIRFVERLLGSDCGMTFQFEQVEYAILSCEMYGRFALHQQALLVKAGEEDEATFNCQVEVLLKWTTDKVIPAFMKSSAEAEANLRDLDLSLISETRESMAPPGSPNTSPPKQKANIGRTPEAMRGFSASMVEGISVNDPAVIFAVNVARSLLANSCRIAAELLAMGSSEVDDMAVASIGWCKVFDKDEQLDETLYRSFLTLAVHLCKASNNFDLFEELLVECNGGLGLEDTTRKALSSIVRVRPDEIVDIFFAVSSRLLKSNEGVVSPSDVNATEVEDVWAERGSVQTLLDMIVGNRMCLLKLGKSLVMKLLGNEDGDGEASPTTIFEAKCLSLVAAKTKNGHEFARILDDFDPKKIENDVAREALSAVLEAVAA